MRCDMCPLAPVAYDDCCPIAESEYGIEHKDGVCGCKHPRNWVEKADRMRSSQYDYIGEYYKEQEYNEKHGVNVSDKDGKYVKYAMHCIGMDHKKPYVRHGKKFYKPYRNYFNCKSDDVIWNALVEIGHAEKFDDEMFCLTEEGLHWIGNILGVIIREV